MVKVRVYHQSGSDVTDSVELLGRGGMNSLEQAEGKKHRKLFKISLVKTSHVFKHYLRHWCNNPLTSFQVQS